MNGPALILGLLFGQAATRLAKIASPALRRSYTKLQDRLEKLVEQSNKKSRQVLEKELNQVAAELRDLAGRETDAVAKKEANAIADELEEGYKKESQKLGENAQKSNPRARAPVNEGHWVGDRNDGWWTSDKPEVNAVTGGKPIRFLNGRPQLHEWSKETLTFGPGQLKGTDADYSLVYDRIAKEKGLKNRTAGRLYLKAQGLSPHHADNVTVELIPTKLHHNLPHIGSASDLRGGFE
jgi:hypothetical protein